MQLLSRWIGVASSRWAACLFSLLLFANFSGLGAVQAQGGRIGITLDCTFMFPLDPSSDSDKAAAQRGMEFQLPW